MAIELSTSLQDRFGLDAPLSASASGLTVADLADHVLALAGTPGAQPGEGATLRAVAERHGGTDLGMPVKPEIVALAERRSLELREITS
jgi:hypothetical protein